MNQDAPTQFPEDAIGTLPTQVPLHPHAQFAWPAVPGYDILAEIGRGGMGVVYRATQRSLSRVVALKMLPGGSIPADLRTRFRQEGEAVARLQHPNIVQIYEIGEADGRPFLALEFVAGGSLHEFLARRPHDVRASATLVQTLAVAVQHAHARGIIHRDLKPGNILLSDEPKDARIAKVTDFGLAKSLESSDGPTRVGDILGTPNYMAPEQAGGVTKTITPTVDIYALGAILYEMLTGRPPFLGANASETVLQVLAQDPVPVRQLRPDCPRDLETICLKCLEKTAGKRYASAEALAEDLRRFLANEPILARPAGPLERAMKWSRRHPTTAALIGGAVVGVIALILGAALYGAQLRRHNAVLHASLDRERKARESAQANFRIARQTVKDLLAEVATKDLESVPYMDPVRRALLQKAVNSQQAFLQQAHDDPSVKRDLALVMGDIGEIHELLGDKTQAGLFMNDAINMHADLAKAIPDDPQHRHDLALARMRLANMLVSDGQFGGVEENYNQAFALMQDLVAANPSVPDYVYELNRIRLNRGRLYMNLGRDALGEADFNQARIELTALTAAHPDNPDYAERLAVSYVNSARAMHTARKLVPASDGYLAAIRILKPQAEKYPDRRSYRLNLGICYRNLADTYWWMTPHQDKKMNEALLTGADASFRMSADVFRELGRDFPGIPDYRHSLARSQEALAEFLDYEKKPGSEPLLESAMATKRLLLDEQPKNPEYLVSFGLSCDIQAARHRRRKEWADAGRWETQAIDKCRAASQLNPQGAMYKAQLAQQLWVHADTLLELKDADAAARAANEYVALSQKGDDLFLGACQLARCAAMAGEPRRREYADQAMDCLGRAIKNGFRDTKKLNETPELELLRKRPDWKSLPMPVSPEAPPTSSSPPK